MDFEPKKFVFSKGVPEPKCPPSLSTRLNSIGSIERRAINKLTVVNRGKGYACSVFLALVLLQSASYAYADQDLTEIRRMAEQGDPAAQNDLGYHYDLGTGVAQDAQQAVAWVVVDVKG